MTADNTLGSHPNLVHAARTGEEPFTSGGRSIGVDLRGFWSWSSSNLLSNTMRGVLAEFIVGVALGCVDGGVRVEWDPTDLCTRDGITVEVKSAAYLQSWYQERQSRISFGIGPTAGWDAETATFDEARRRRADVYVFCLFTHLDPASADPLNADQWAFYVLPTSRLDAEVGDQQTIGLGSLEKLDPARASFAGLRACIEAAVPAR